VANKALELLGTTAELRLWVEQIEARGADDLSRMYDEALEAFIAEFNRASCVAYRN
jgi:hypothetical protein